MDFRCLGSLSLVSLLGLASCASAPRRGVVYVDPAVVPDAWRTQAERTDYVETGRYDEAVAFCRRLAATSPFARFTSFGRSGEGRELPLLILSADQAFTPEAARASGKLVVLLENCIHPGECAGKDASLELARDILITGTRQDLLAHVNILIMPIFNADGHERFSPYARINQNGPKEMGWRVTATNLNLNRDFTKADAVEMQAWLRTWVAWEPDLLIDNHTTDGGDHQYALLYIGTTGPLVAAPIGQWMSRTLLARVLPALEADGHLTMPYGGPRDRQDLSQGVSVFTAGTPCYSTGYAAVCNRPALLLEAHALKPYEQRVRVTYAFMVRVLEELNRRPDTLRQAIRQADAHTIAPRGGDGPEGQVVLREQLTDEAEPFRYRGVACTTRPSEITGGEIIEYSDRPLDVDTRIYRQTRVSKAVTPPAAHLVPPQWGEVIQRLELHGIEFFRLGQAERLEIESYRFEDVKFPSRPHEGRFMPQYTAVPVRETRAFVAGTVVVPLAQRRAKVAVHLLEPEAPDALVAWGFFNAIFEQKEYAEAYVLEPIAQRMLAADPELKREFEEKLRTDPEFAKSSGARLDFFYRRSPYWDERFNIYPVARLENVAVLERLRANASVSGQ